MPIYIKVGGIDGHIANAVYPQTLPIADFTTLSGSAFGSCTSGVPDTVCVSLDFRTLSFPDFDAVILNFTNPVTGATGSTTSLFANGSFDTYGTYTSNDGGATLVLSPVPEAGVWLMLIAGFGLLGAALRRRRAPLTAAP